MNADARDIRIGRAAGILPRIGELCVLNQQVTGSHFALLRNNAHAASVAVIANHLLQVIPKNIRRRLRRVAYCASQVYRAALVNV